MKNNTFFTGLILLMVSIFAQETMAQPANDACSAATSITSNATCVYTNGTVDGATATPGLAQGSCDAYSGSYAGEDVWYTFVPQYATNTVKVDGSSSIDPVLVIYTGSCGNFTEFDCNDTSGNSHATINNANFVVGQTYYIRVYDYGSMPPSDGTFQICITHNASGGNVDLEYESHITLDGISGHGSGDADGAAEPGEQIELPINIRNNGTNTAHNISGTLSTTDSDITINAGTFSMGDLNPNTTAIANGILFSISAAAIEKDVIMNLTINCDEGSFNDSFLFHINDGNISLHKVDQLIRDGNGGGVGNSNGRLDPGEDIMLEIKIHNSGASIAHNTTSTLSTLDSDINITNASVNLGDVGANSDVWAQSFGFSIYANTPEKDVVFTLATTSDEGSWVDTFVMHVNQATAVEKLQKDEVNIYPNPTKDYLNISLENDAEIESVEIFNMNGQKVLNGAFEQNIDVSNLRSGLYILKLIGAKKIGTFRFIKE